MVQDRLTECNLQFSHSIVVYAGGRDLDSTSVRRGKDSGALVANAKSLGKGASAAWRAGPPGELKSIDNHTSTTDSSGSSNDYELNLRRHNPSNGSSVYTSRDYQDVTASSVDTLRALSIASCSPLPIVH